MARKKLPKLRYDKLVSPGTFLGDYLSYMDQNETATAYDFWTAIWLLSVAVGRGCIVNRPRAPVYLNLFAILVAESGITRKSSAIREAVRFARPLCSGSPRLVETKTTPEFLEEILYKQSKQYGQASAAIAISELVTFLGRERYNESMPTLLTDLYDCPELRDGGGTMGGGSRRLENIFVSFLSASTPSWLLRAVNPDVIEGGFTSRVLFIVAEEPKRLNSWPDATRQADADLTEKLRVIRERAASIGTIEISDGARKAFDKWYKSRTLYRDPFRASFQSREDAHILRLAAFLCINDGNWVIQHTHILSAIKVIIQVREDGASIFEGTGANSRFVVGIDKIRDKLLAAGLNGLPQRELTKAVAPFMDAKHMTAALDIMHDLGMVQQFQVPQLARGRPVTIWRALQPLTGGKALDTIFEQFGPTR